MSTTPALDLELDGKSHRLAAGQMLHRAADLLYRDAPDALLETIQAEIATGRPWREVVAHHLTPVNPWLLRVVSEPSRTLWLDQRPPRPGSWVLDVGSGWGQWAIPAAARANVVALEPNPVRLATIQAIARQEGVADRMFFVGAPMQDVAFAAQRFDEIYCIGVLEWVPRFSADADPRAIQLQFLRRLRELLADDGECVIGIENRLGLKYLLGARDDHTGIAGVSVLEAPLAAQRHEALTGQPLRVFTYSQAEYRDLLAEAGFGATEFFGAFPDYKVPRVILPLAGDAANAYAGAIPYVDEHDGCNGEPLPFQEQLASHYRSLGRLGVTAGFAPSFFIRAGRNRLR